MPGADPASQHDVTDSGDGGDFRQRSRGLRVERIALWLSQRITTADRQDANAGIHSIGRHDPEHVRALPDRTEHIADSIVPGGEDTHPATGLPDG